MTGSFLSDLGGAQTFKYKQSSLLSFFKTTGGGNQRQTASSGASGISTTSTTNIESTVVAVTGSSVISNTHTKIRYVNLASLGK